MILMSQLLKRINVDRFQTNYLTLWDTDTRVEHTYVIKDGYFLGSQGKSAYDLAVENGYTGTSDTWLLSLKGEDGDQGPKGEQGEPGEKGMSAYDVATTTGVFSGSEEEWLTSLIGPAGPAGPAGTASVKLGNIYFQDGLLEIKNRGTDSEAVLDFYFPEAIINGGVGKDGRAATIEIGTVTTVASGALPVVSMRGTKSAAILDFALPMGKDGANGSPGTPGTPGANGQNGLSAYELATLGGAFSGTLDEWLDSLKQKPVWIEDACSVEMLETSAQAMARVDTLDDGRLKFTFRLPRGLTGATPAGTIAARAGTISIGRVTSGNTASVINVGTDEDAILDFVLPRGEQGIGSQGGVGPTGPAGPAPQFTIGSVTALAAGQTPTVSITSIDSSTGKYSLSFGIPRGSDGNPGTPGVGLEGRAATIAIGQVISGNYAAVTNTGTETDAILNFVLPTEVPDDNAGDNVNPPTPGSGTIGTPDSPWGSGAFLHLYLNGYSVMQRVVFEVSQQWTVPDGVTEILISGCAGGGAGSVCMGGGSGQSVFRRRFAVTPKSKIEIHVGAGGNSSGRSFGQYDMINETMEDIGGTGGNTYVGNLITLEGGTGGRIKWTRHDFTPEEVALFADSGADSDTFTIQWDYEPGSAGSNLAASHNNIYGSEHGGTWFTQYNDNGQYVQLHGGRGGNSLFGTGGTGGFIAYQHTTSRGSTHYGTQTYSPSPGIGYGSGGGGGYCLVHLSISSNQGLGSNAAKAIWRPGPGEYMCTGSPGANGLVIIEWGINQISSASGSDSVGS